MDAETQMNGNRFRDAPAEALARNRADIARDLLEIADLQAQLFAADMRELARKVAWTSAAWLVAALLLGAVLPVALAGIGLAVAAWWELSPAAGLLLAAPGGLVIVAGLLIAGWIMMRSQMGVLERSRRELRENLALVKRMLASHSSRPETERAR